VAVEGEVTTEEDKDPDMRVTATGEDTAEGCEAAVNSKTTSSNRKQKRSHHQL